MPTEIDGDMSIKNLVEWLEQHEGSIHPAVFFKRPDGQKTSKYYGYSAMTRTNLASGTLVASCPFNLVITVDAIRDALLHYCSIKGDSGLSQRQLLCLYICLHWIFPEEEEASKSLRHRPYIQSLTPVEHLFTPHYFTEEELELFRGTNLFGATAQRREALQTDWKELLRRIPPEKQFIAEQITWDRYLAASTYLSSRAFPSTLLSSVPSLISTDASYPVLIPGVDLFNHSRAHPVTWEVSPTRSSTDLSISLKQDAGASAGTELFNNYGPKPNASLILGYGFSLENNPDDTIMLKIGGQPTTHGALELSHEIGRNAANVGALWASLRALVLENMGHQDGDSDELEEETGPAHDIEADLQTCEVLADMINDLIARLPPLKAVQHESAKVREEVVTMWKHYVQGQVDILASLLAWVKEKEREVMRSAEEAGIQFMTEEGTEES